MREIRNYRRAADARIVVLKGRVRLSSRACHILGITPINPCVRFYEDRGRIYIANANSPDGYRTSRRRQTAEINCTPLASFIADTLHGFGIYRIMEEDYTFENGTVCYRISPEKYERQ